GESFMAVLAKILLEHQPRPSELEPRVLPALDDLTARMLSKDPAGRPADGAAVAVAIDALGDVGGARPAQPAETATPALTVGEQRLLTVVLAGSGETSPPDHQGTALMPTMERRGNGLGELRSEIARFGGQIEKLVDGSIVVTFLARGAATDQ